MIEKVNPLHPDKVADRIAGALVDCAYRIKKNPKVAVEVLIGHRKALIINETDTKLSENKTKEIFDRYLTGFEVEYHEVMQNEILNNNQNGAIKCGDNGIFVGIPTSKEEIELSELARKIYSHFNYDGKYILDADSKILIICQSNAEDKEIIDIVKKYQEKGYIIKINPLGYWTGGTDVDSGATNRKLGSDMGRAVTGGGLHGKDLSKADVSVNIYAHIKAQETNKEQRFLCGIGDKEIDGKPYQEIVEIARSYIHKIGGFEKFAEWGLF